MTNDARMWAMFCHLAALVSFLGVPFGGIVGPLIVWLIKKDEYPLVDQQGKESLNFQITVMIAAICCIPLVFFIIGIVLLPAILIANLVLVIMAAVKTSNGERFEYPMTIRLIN